MGHNTVLRYRAACDRWRVTGFWQCVSWANERFYSHFAFPCVRPWENRGKCYMDRKRIQCLSNASQRVHIYLQPFTSYSEILVGNWCNSVNIQNTKNPKYTFVGNFIGDFCEILTKMTSLLWRQLYLEHNQSVQYFPQQISFTTLLRNFHISLANKLLSLSLLLNK